MRPFFFVHVMKTAGGTFGQHVRRNFVPRERYPNGEDPRGAYFQIAPLRDLTDERRARVRCYKGHFPFFVARSIGEPIVMTVLRDPIERTLSWLRRERDTKFPRLSLDEVYDDDLARARLVRDHMTKVFSLDEADEADSFMRIIDVDEHRLAVAKVNLDACDLVGVQERFDQFCNAVVNRFGWEIAAVEHRHVSTAAPASSALRTRIAEDVRYDMELYEHGLKIATRRGHRG